MKIKVIIFDQDETLIQPDTGLYEEYVVERAKDFSHVYGIDDLEKAKQLAFKMKMDECNHSTIELYDKMGISRSVWYDKINNIDARPYLKKDLSLKHFLRQLKNRGLLIFLLTNSPTIQTKKILEFTGIPIEIFDGLFTWERDREPPKPLKEPFEKIFNKYKVQPEECIMVGNEIKVDLQTAHTLGVNTVGINLESNPDENVDFTVDKLEGIFKIINKLNI